MRKGIGVIVIIVIVMMIGIGYFVLNQKNSTPRLIPGKRKNPYPLTRPAIWALVAS